MNAYYVNYRLCGGQIEGIGLLAKNKEDAYDTAVFELIPEKCGELPYSAWVSSVTYNNGNCHYFNTHEGKPY